MAPRVVILVAAVASLALPAAASAVPVPAMTPPVTVVPSPGLPPDVQVDHSNANLAVAYYRGRVFMVFRTAKWQIADDNARLYVISSADQVHWRLDGTFSYGRDLREPRLFVWKRKLFLYFALLGSNAAAFEPGGEMATRWLATGKWVKPRRILQFPDFIAWAVKAHRGRVHVDILDEEAGEPRIFFRLAEPLGERDRRRQHNRARERLENVFHEQAGS